jgi:negative regulator of flagellin synthesis FlgM
MAIEISGSTGAHHTIGESQKQQQVQPQQNTVAPTAPAASNASNVDSVNLTGTASQLRALEQQLASQPVVNTQRVSAIRHEINSGQFTVNPERIADKMIQIESMISNRLG